jgi:hypothetical protein
MSFQFSVFSYQLSELLPSRAQLPKRSASKIGENGQTLIALLMFMLLAITITITSVAITIINLQSGTALATGETALDNANVGAENAVLRLERDSTYAGETMTLASGTATITISGTTTKTIVSVGAVGSYRRTVTVVASNSGNIITPTSWSETP